MGNVESASENLDEAMTYFNRAVEIREGIGDDAASQLALTYLCIARVYYLQEDFEEASAKLAQSEALFVRTDGSNTQFMAHVSISSEQSLPKACRKRVARHVCFLGYLQWIYSQDMFQHFITQPRSNNNFENL